MYVCLYVYEPKVRVLYFVANVLSLSSSISCLHTDLLTLRALFVRTKFYEIV